MLQKGLFNSNDNSEFDEIVFDQDPISNTDDDQPIKVDIELYKPAKVDDNHYHHSRVKSDSENFYHKPKLSEFETFNIFPEFF